MNATRDDRIFRSTRIVAGVVVPILALACVILYFFPGTSGARFAWEIQPPMTAAFIGAGYLGGAVLFVHAVFGRRWHRVAAGFPVVSVFTIAMLAVTILHWERFDLGHFPFQVWLVLYVVTPILIPVLWLRNRVTDPGTPEAADRVVPWFARWGLAAVGLIMWGFSLAGFFRPDWLIAIWVWKLTPLTARVMAGWFALLGTGGLVIARDSRWTAWRAGMQSIGLWHLLVVIAAVLHPGDFTHGLANWYLGSVVIALVGMVILYITMEDGKILKGTGRQASAHP
jgi:hypothetical protein